MKTRIPAKYVTCCDLCKRETLVLTKCLVCGRDYCITCNSVIAGCMVSPDVCKECSEFSSVRKVVERYVPFLVAILKRRDAALRRCKPDKQPQKDKDVTS